MINKNQIIIKKNIPYPYTIIKNFFEDKFYLNLKKNFPSEIQFNNQANKIKRMHFDTSYGDDLYDNLIEQSEEYKLLHEYIYSKEFINFFINHFRDDIDEEIRSKNLSEIYNFEIEQKPFEKNEIFNTKNFVKDSINKKILYPRIDLGIGKINYGLVNGGKGIHVDNPQRLISIIFYIGGFKKIEGGEFRVWHKVNDELRIFETIPPQENMMIVSLQNNHSFHDVNPVTEIDGSRNAFYMAISSNSKIWKDIEDTKINLNYNKNRYVSKNFFRNLKLKNVFTKIFK